jgi:hypothetical protein
LQTIEVGKAEDHRKGIGTEFFRALCMAASKLGRGVRLEQCITDSSRAWAAKMVRQGLMTQDVRDTSSYNTVPDVCQKLEALKLEALKLEALKKVKKDST